MLEIFRCSSAFEKAIDLCTSSLFGEDEETKAINQNIPDLTSSEISSISQLMLLGHSVRNVVRSGCTLSGLSEKALATLLAQKYPNKQILTNVYLFSCEVGLVKNKTSYAHELSKQMQINGFNHVIIHALLCPEKNQAHNMFVESIGAFNKYVTINAGYYKAGDKIKYDLCKDATFLIELMKPQNTILPKKQPVNSSRLFSLRPIVSAASSTLGPYRNKLEGFRTELKQYIDDRENESKINLTLFIFMIPYYLLLDFWHGNYGTHSPEGHFDLEGRVTKINKAKNLVSHIDAILVHNHYEPNHKPFRYDSEKTRLGVINNKIFFSYKAELENYVEQEDSIVTKKCR